MTKFARPALAAIAFLLLSGCYTQWRYDLGDHLTRRNLDQLENGMPMKDVLAVFGPPQRMSASVSGYIMAWEHWQVDEDTLGFRLGPLGAEEERRLVDLVHEAHRDEEEAGADVERLVEQEVELEELRRHAAAAAGAGVLELELRVGRQTRTTDRKRRPK